MLLPSTEMFRGHHMFIGHYSAAFAAGAARPGIPLWHLFVAVQLVDFAWAGLVLAGVERLRLEPGFLAASMLDLQHMPYTHSLVAALLWSLVAGWAYGRFLAPSASRRRDGIVIGLAVFSHWWLDLIVHAPDLALYPGGPKVGLGLWQWWGASQLAEIGALLVAAAFYLRGRRGRGLSVRGPVVLVLLMALVQITNALPADEAPAVPVFAVTALAAYALLALGAWWVERERARAADASG